ncbi:MAG: UDP-N-acetylmuramate dehydrogenase [Clostridia bacterium]|nr:UDP-N-acetylmuramate dehydrogenase [Clostridia bacterium]
MRESVLSLSNVSLANFCTYHIGGKARSLKIVYDSAALVDVLTEDSVVVGCGSKLLISDSGYDGTIVLVRFSGVKISENGVYAYAGTPLPALSRFCSKHSLGGLEWACGIPGSVGGAVKLNAGAFGMSMDSVVERVDVLQKGKVASLKANELDYSYRHSGIEGIVLGAQFKCQAVDAEQLELRCKSYVKLRRESQPRGFSCGSIFKNSDKPAGWYIEQAGLKGLKCGGAIISKEHANFIINLGDASSRDVYTLIRTAKAEVKSKFDVTLNEEVIYLGDF